MAMTRVFGFLFFFIVGLTAPFLRSEVPNTFVAGQPAKASEVNENFSTLNTKVEALSSPGKSYSVLSTETLDSGLVRTKLYAYELSDYSGYTRYDSSNSNLYLGEGTEYIVNALGEFRGEWSYIGDFTQTFSDPNDADTSPIACQDGSAMTRYDGDVVYSLTWRNERGAFAFSNRGTVNAGIYLPNNGCKNFTDDSGVAREIGEYYYLEGKGVGIYSCVERAAWYGAYLTQGSFWEKIYARGPSTYPYGVTGVFDRSNNGVWGTYYLEIDAPADCLKLN